MGEGYFGRDRVELGENIFAAGTCGLEVGGGVEVGEGVDLRNC